MSRSFGVLMLLLAAWMFANIVWIRLTGHPL